MQDDEDKKIEEDEEDERGDDKDGIWRYNNKTK